MAALIFLSSTPPTIEEGSGTWVGISVLRTAVVALGHEVALVAPPTPSRIAFNLRVRSILRAMSADALVGFDLDGVFVQRRGMLHVAAIKGVLADDPMSHLISTDDRARVIELIREHLAPDGRVVLEGLYRPAREATVVRACDVEERWEPVGSESLWRATYRYDDAEATTLLRSWTLEEIDRLRLAGLEIEALWGDFDERPFEPTSLRMVIVAKYRRLPAGGCAGY